MNFTSLFLGFFLGIIFVFITFSISIFIANRRFLKKSMKALQIDNKEIRNLISKKQKNQLSLKYIIEINNLKRLLLIILF